ncbi:hypothetical protein OIU78_024916 [Salix suchowensis]|nr:hypothetical protein OIU78_024916 [Salix suchowensis]
METELLLVLPEKNFTF